MAEKSVKSTTKTKAKVTTAKAKTASKANVTKTKAKATPVKAKDLIIVESPTKAKKISNFLGAKYSVIASNGHIRDLPKSKLGIDVENGFSPEYITVRGKGTLISDIKKRAKASNKIYLATDPDREGEAISWHLAAILGIDDKEKCRIVFNEITLQAVKASLSSAREIDSGLVDAQQARRVLDRLVGYKISPLLWAKVKRGLSAGRVQSVATRMICDREEEINNFVPEEYWSIIASLLKDGHKKAFSAKFYGFSDKKTDVRSEKDATEIVDKSKRIGKLTVTNIKVASKSRHAQPPFTTSSMQQEASKKLGFTSERTMRIAQDLYEGASFDSGLITYMRTDSFRVSAEAQKEALELIKNKYGADYAPKTPNFYKGKKGAQDAHEAIRPTSLSNTPQKIKDKLTPQQYKLYKLIYERFLASQMTPAIIESTTVSLNAENLTYRATGTRKLFAGYTIVYNEDSDEEKDENLPPLSENEVLKVVDVDSEQHFTQPPNRYNDATLIKALDEYGIGRPSTYAPTIMTIIARGYVVRDKRMLLPTELGIIVTNIMKESFSDIVDIKFTADLEDELDKIEDGNVEWQNIISEFYSPFIKTVEKAQETLERVVIPDEVSDVPCDKCGAMMVYKMGRFGRFLACPNYPECKNTKPIIIKIDTPCPKCGAALVKRSKRGTNKYFYGCERYPDCDFASKDLPLNEKCPVCGEHMVQVITEKGRFKTCSNRECSSRKRKKATNT